MKFFEPTNIFHHSFLSGHFKLMENYNNGAKIDTSRAH